MHQVWRFLVGCVRFLADARFDLRHGFRVLWRSPSFSVFAVLSLGLGIGATTSIFSVLDQLLLRSLPVGDPRQLALLTLTVSNQTVELAPGEVWNLRETLSSERPGLIYGLYRDLRDSNRVFSELLAARSPTSVRFSTGAEVSSEQVQAAVVSGNYFLTLAVKPLLGRVFTKGDDQVPGRGGVEGPVVVLSYRYWQRRFATNRAVVGRSIQLNDTRFTIVGIAPPAFEGESVGSPADLWVPAALQSALFPSSTLEMSEFTIIGRLKPEITRQQAQDALQALLPRLPNWPRGWKPAWFGILVKNGSRGISALRQKLTVMLIILMCAGALLLLIACANVGTLLLARAASRRAEIVVRLSMGACRAQLLRQLLTESLLLATIGATAGLFLARWGASLFVALLSGDSPDVLMGFHADVRVLGFAGATTVATAVLFGLAPALHYTQIDLGSAARATYPSSKFGKTSSRLLIGTQVALSVVLLTGALLFVRTLHNLEALEIGFDREHTLLITFDLGNAGYRSEQLTQFVGDLERRIRTLPGVVSTSASTGAPFGEPLLDNTPIEVPAYGADDHVRTFNAVGPDFFRTTGIPIVRGREFNAQDRFLSRSGADSLLRPSTVSVVNEAFVRQFFSGSNAVGRRFLFGSRHITVEVVGVARDAKYGSLREQVVPMIYMPLGGRPNWNSLYLFVRFAGGSYRAASLMSPIRIQVRQAAASVRVSTIDTLQHLVRRSLVEERMAAGLASISGVLAMLLVAVGIYGVVAYALARRTQELGIRIALGASRADIHLTVLGSTITAVLGGITVGVPIALATAHLISTKLFSVSPSDAIAVVGSISLITAIAAIATYIPARRAANVDPAAALHYE